MHMQTDGTEKLKPNELLKHFGWAGPRRLRFADNIMATALKYNVFDQLARYGGYDLFVIKPGPIRSPDGTRWEQPEANPWNGGYEALRPDTVNSGGRPDTLTIFAKGEEKPLPHNASDPRWSNYVLAQQHHSRQPEWTQNVLYQLFDQYLCNQLVRNYSAREKISYRWKMRMRTDVAFTHPIPNLRSLDFGSKKHPFVLVTSSKYFAGANQDSFAVGEAEVMDAYFDRFKSIHTATWLTEKVWTLEEYLMRHLKSRLNATVREHDNLRAMIVRTHGFLRGRSAKSVSVSSKRHKETEQDSNVEGYQAKLAAMQAASYKEKPLPDALIESVYAAGGQA